MLPLFHSQSVHCVQWGYFNKCPLLVRVCLELTLYYFGFIRMSDNNIISIVEQLSVLIKTAFYNDHDYLDVPLRNS